MTDQPPTIASTIEIVPIEEVKPCPQNAKKHRKGDIRLLADHIAASGWDQPIVIVGDGPHRGEIIKGHKRRAAAVLLGMTSVPVIRLCGLTEVQIEERRLADNKLAESPWDAQVLRDRIKFLMDQGSRIQSLGFADLAAQIRAQPTRPEVQFSEVLGESQNYVVLTFDNDLDWLSAQTHFQLETVASRRGNPEREKKGKPWSCGIGRVLDGGKYLRRIKGGES